MKQRISFPLPAVHTILLIHLSFGKLSFLQLVHSDQTAETELKAISELLCVGVYDYVHSVSELGEEGAGGVRGPVLFPPLPPNCRIREVHCGSQVRLVVIAIRDIAKGEEITVDYNLAEWGENALVIKLRYFFQDGTFFLKNYHVYI